MAQANNGGRGPKRHARLVADRRGDEPRRRGWFFATGGRKIWPSTLTAGAGPAVRSGSFDSTHRGAGFAPKAPISPERGWAAMYAIIQFAVCCTISAGADDYLRHSAIAPGSSPRSQLPDLRLRRVARVAVAETVEGLHQPVAPATQRGAIVEELVGAAESGILKHREHDIVGIAGRSARDARLLASVFSSGEVTAANSASQRRRSAQYSSSVQPKAASRERR